MITAAKKVLMAQEKSFEIMLNKTRIMLLRKQTRSSLNWTVRALNECMCLWSWRWMLTLYWVQQSLAALSNARRKQKTASLYSAWNGSEWTGQLQYKNVVTTSTGCQKTWNKKRWWRRTKRAQRERKGMWREIKRLYVFSHNVWFAALNASYRY